MYATTWQYNTFPNCALYSVISPLTYIIEKSTVINIIFNIFDSLLTNLRFAGLKYI